VPSLCDFTVFQETTPPSAYDEGHFLLKSIGSDTATDLVLALEEKYCTHGYTEKMGTRNVALWHGLERDRLSEIID
jgi:hypothetical protein